MPKPTTEYQRYIARLLRVDVTNDTQAVAAARILNVVEAAIDPGACPRSATPRQIDFAHSLGLVTDDDSFHVCSAKIEDRLRTLNEEALARLQLKPGDRVVKTETSHLNGEVNTFSREYIVSSISTDCRVWFRGGNGAGGWPTQLTRVESAGSA